MPGLGPTVPPPQPPDLKSALGRNIEALRQRREREGAVMSRQERIAEAITNFAGSIAFVYIHLAIFGFWVVANLGWVPVVPAWDPSFVVLAMVASVEAIFLSTFVLITQNRMAADNDRRADLDLQINLLAEHEVSRLIEMLSAVVKHLGVDASAAEEVEDLKRDVAPEAVLDAIEDSKE